MKPYLVIGAGLTGATIARQLADAGYHVEVIDSRDHVAGNAYDEVDKETGIRFHRYGPHLFHTNNKKVVDFLSRFTSWYKYHHKVMALVGDDYVPFPPMLDAEPSSEEREALLDLFFRPYTWKMWGMRLDDMDPSVVARVPIKVGTSDTGYFKDEYQYIPVNGYTKMVENMLDHENITVILGEKVGPNHYTNWNVFEHIFNGAPIDDWYKYRYGELPYRSIKFHHQIVNAPKVLPTATVNYTHDDAFTRVTEWKNISGHSNGCLSQTLLTYEEPCDYKDNGYERYYPVKDLKGENRAIYQKYAEHAKNVDKNMTFVGRCGQYVYIDMHQAVNSGLQISSKHIQ